MKILLPFFLSLGIIVSFGGAPGGPWKSTAYAQQSGEPIVNDIQIRGNKKIEADAIRAKLINQRGEPVNREVVRKEIEALFDMKFFYDIVVEEVAVEEGKVNLIYTVVERPSVEEIVFNGNEEMDAADLQEAIDIRQYDILDFAQVQNAERKLEALYEEKGFFLAEVDSHWEEIRKDEAVRLFFDIQENDKVNVKRISIVGNENLSDSELKSKMLTQEKGFFNFFSGSGSYKAEMFERDVQVLARVYQDEGYVQAKIFRPEISVSPDKKHIFITIRVDEGDQFKIGEVDFAGDLLFEDQEMREAIALKEGEVFSKTGLERDIMALQAKYGDLGYAFANIIPRSMLNPEEKKVNITYEIDKGYKVYFGEINIVGNTSTRDKVIRRELKIREGELYNETRKRESEAAVRRTGYFEDIRFSMTTPPDRPEILNVDIIVKERNTGSINVGAGYSSYQGFIMNGSVSEINLFGRGQQLSATLNLSDRQSEFKVSFTEPYAFDTNWLLGFELYQKRDKSIEYEDFRKGGSVRVGHPLAPFLKGFITYRLDETEIKLTDQGDPDLMPVDTANGTTSSSIFSLEYDRRNDRMMPSDGIYSLVSLEYAGLGGDKNYTKGGFNFRFYHNVFWDVVWRNNLTYGFIKSNDDSPVPFNELFRLGGPYSLRGYKTLTVGKRVFSQRQCDAASSCVDENNPGPDKAAFLPLGGKQRLFYNLEMEFPLIKEAGIRGVVFYDIGNAEDTIQLDDLLSDWGFGFRWFSPIGPLRFEWGFPFNPRPEYGEKNMNFEFSIGAPF